jgi:ubiquinone/menaquinone biosynthesis C-methylase UbiE
MIVQNVKWFLYQIGVPKSLSARRLQFINKILNGRLGMQNHPPMRILDVGCARGKDMVQLLKERKDIEMVGLDLSDYGLRQRNFDMVVADAERIPFPDLHFDLTVSIGVLEHIVPIEKLARVISEIKRVSRSYVIIVPSAGSIIEPHIARFFWHLRDRNKKKRYAGSLIYMSDETWLAFDGFRDAKSRRFYHIPLFVSNLAIFEAQ